MTQERAMFNTVVRFLAEFFPHRSARKTILSNAFYGQRILDKVDYDGSAREFATELVMMLRQHGEIEQGTQALWQLLITIAEDLGDDRKRQIEGFKAWANSSSFSSAEDAVTKSELEMLLSVANGIDIDHIAKLLSLTPEVVRETLGNIRSKLGVSKLPRTLNASANPAVPQTQDKVITTKPSFTTIHTQVISDAATRSDSFLGRQKMQGLKEVAASLNSLLVNLEMPFLKQSMAPLYDPAAIPFLKQSLAPLYDPAAIPFLKQSLVPLYDPAAIPFLKQAAAMTDFSSVKIQMQAARDFENTGTSKPLAV